MALKRRFTAKAESITAPQVEELESRLLLSADPVGAFVPDSFNADPIAIEYLLDENLDVITPVSGLQDSDDERLELVFVDSDTPDYQQLVDDLLIERNDGRRIDVYVLDNNRDGIRQISDVLETHQAVDAIHLISHGADGSLDLGSTRLSNDTLAQYQQSLQGWAAHLDAEADILIYGCSLAATEQGQGLVDALGLLTETDVAASDDLTGHASVGGDWQLEYQKGEVESTIALSADARQTWRSSLDISSNLELHLDFEDGSGSTATDVSGNNNHGNLVGSPVWTSGEISGGVKVDYTDGDDYVEIPNSPNLQDVQEGDYTLASWFRPDSTPPGSGSDADANYGILIKEGWHTGLYYGNDNRFHFDQVLTGNQTEAVVSTNTYSPGQFYHVAGVLDRVAGTMEIYVDGVLQGTTNFTPGAVALEYGTESWTLGVANASGGVWSWTADGAIDDARIYSRALTASDISELQTYTTSSGLVAHYTFDEGSGVTAVDSTVYVNDGSVVSATYIAGNVGSGALDFGGDFDRVEASDIAATDFGSGDFSSAFWFNSTQSGATGRLLGDTDGGDGYVFYTTGSGEVNLNVFSGANTVGLVANGIFDGQWHHVTGIRSGADFSLVVDGILADSTTNGSIGSLDNSVALTIGASNATQNDFDGLIDDVRLYNRALNTGDIADLVAMGSNANPVIDSNGGGDTAAVNVAENTTAVTTVTATDAELDTLTFSLYTGSDDDGFFNINSTSGVLTFAIAPNFETPADLNGDNIYEVTVRVADGNGGVDSQAISVTVTDALELVVSNTNATGTGSLHEAILNANANIGVTDTITFNIGGGGAQTILVDPAGLPMITDPVIMDATSQPGYAGTPLITLDGSAAPAASGINGITLQTDDSTVKGFIIINFPDEGIEIDGSSAFGSADNNTVQGNWIGIDKDGAIAGVAEHGIMINDAATGNQIGGTGLNEGNVIGGNGFSGIIIRHNSDNNIVEGNIIGLKADGVSLAGNGDHGIEIVLSSDGNQIGGSAPGAGNIISANGKNGILVDGFTDATYTTAVTGTVIHGNYIGTDATGAVDLGNIEYGVEILNASGNTIGGIDVSEGNLISGNTQSGISLWGGTTSSNTISGNYIGTNAAGTGLIGNTNDGISIGGGANNNTIGGDRTAGEGNVIAGNEDGIELNGTGTDNNKIHGNYIGTNFDGSDPLGNLRHGVAIHNGAQDTELGGTGTGEGNIISGNIDSGVIIDGNGTGTTSGNIIQGNIIGLDATGSALLANGKAGVEIFGDSGANTIGGNTPSARNIISGNTDGIYIQNADGTIIQGNYIGTDITGLIDLGNTDRGIQLESGADNTVIGGIGAATRNVISGNTNDGIIISDGASPGTGTTGAVIQGNYIGIGSDGTTAIGNGTNGIRITTESGHLIGGTVADTGNVIAHNGEDGVLLSGSTAISNSILGNSIYQNTQRGIDLGNDGVSANDISGTPPVPQHDADTGANSLQNFPQLFTAVYLGGNTTIAGQINSAPTTTYRIEFFSSPEGTEDGTGYGEGEVYLGFVDVTTDALGDANINAVLAIAVGNGDRVTATATVDLGAGNYGDTSEFAMNIVAVANSAPTDITVPDGLQLVGDWNSYFNIPDAVQLRGASDFTLEFSFTTGTSIPANEEVFSKTSDYLNEGITIKLFGGDIELLIGEGDGTPVSLVAGVSLLANTDYHLSMVRDGDDFLIYLDGNLQSSVNVSTFNVSSEDLSLGKNSSNILTDFRYWDEARTQSEISQFAGETLSGTEPNLLVYHAVDQTNGITSLDLTGNGHDATLIGLTESDWIRLNIDEGSSNGASVGPADVVDPNLADTHTFTLVDDASGRFAIDLNTGEITIADGSQIDFEADTAHDVIIRVTDNGGLFYDEVVTINVNDVADNAAPVVTFGGGNVSYTENATAIFIDAGATVTDADLVDFDGGVLTISIPVNGSGADRVRINNEGMGAGEVGMTSGPNEVYYGGVLIGTWSGSGAPLAITFNAAADATAVEAVAQNITFENLSDTPSTATRTIQFVLTDGDGGISTAITKDITVVAVNDAPTLTVSGTGSVAAGGTYTLNLTATDPEGVTITSWTINWGDGSIQTIAGNPSSVTHTYISTLGGFTMNLTASATDADGTHFNSNLLVPTFAGTDAVHIYNGSTGNFVQTIAPFADGIDDHVNIVTGPNGNYFISGYTSDNVLEYQPDGTFVGVFVAAGAGGVDAAAGLSFGPDGNLYIASSFTSEILRYNGADGTFIDAFVPAGTAGINSPLGITFGPDGDLYVASRGANGILKFDGATGAHDATFTSISVGDAEDITIGPDGNIYLASLGGGVLQFDITDGSLLSTFVAIGSGGLVDVAGITFGPDGNLYIGDQAGDAVRRYNGTTGAYIDDYVPAGVGGLDGSTYLAFAAEHQIKVSANNAPVLSSASGDMSYTENNSAVGDSGILLSDLDTINMSGAVISISSGYIDGQDELVYTTTAGITGVWNSAAGTMTLSGTATVADYQAALREVKYQNTSEAPNATTRKLSYTVSDGVTSSNALDRNVLVYAVNDTPVVSSPISVNATEGFNLALQGAGITVSDVDSANTIVTTTITVTEGIIVASSGNSGISVSNGNSDTVTITGTITQINNWLAGTTTGTLSYQTNIDNPSASATLTIRVNDQGNVGSDPGLTGDATSEEGSSSTSINITSVNDAPSGADIVVTATEDTDYVFTEANFGFTDVETDVLLNVVIASLPVNGTLYLDADLDGIVDGGEALIASSVVTVADITAGRLKFQPASDANGAAYDSFTFQVQDDGGVASSGVDIDQSANTITIDVTAQNDAPTITGKVDPFINEIHYDNSGSDTGEAIEVAGVAGTDLTGWTLVFYNGGDDSVYRTESLAGTISDQGNGFGTIVVNLPVNGIQNDTEALALVNDSGEVIEFISYEGTLVAADGPATGLTSVDIGVAESGTTLVGDSLQRTGAGPGYIWTTESANSFGSVNTGQTFDDSQLHPETVAEDIPLVFSVANGNSLKVSDPDADDGIVDPLKLVLSVADGTLTLGSTVGLSGLVGNGTGIVTLYGSVAELNSALEGLTYQGDLNFNGNDTLSIDIDDQGNTGIGGSLTDSASVDITVTRVNDGPAITSTAGPTATEDTLYTYTATVTDPDDANNGTDLTWSLSGAPAGMVVSSTGVVTWTPAEGVTTSGAVTLTVSDGNEDGAVDATEVFTIIVTPVNQGPSITSTAGTSATEDGLYTYAAIVADPDDVNNGTDLTWTLSGAPAGMVVSSTGVVTWTPAEGVTTSGAVTLTVSDGNEDGAVDATEVFTITVTPVNDAPTITSTASTTATEDTLYTYTATVNDPDDANNGTDLTWTLSGAPAGMVVSSTGVVTWTPAEGVTTSGAVTLTVSDGNEDGAVDVTEVFTITVTPVNDAPGITSTAGTSATEDSLYTYTATVTDPDDANNGTDLTWTLSGAPAGMVVSSTGVVTWTPAEGVTTSGAVTLTVSDGNEDGAVDATEVFTIIVTPVNQGPSITSTAGTSATEDNLYTYTATVTDPDDANNGTDLTWTLSGAPAGMVVSSTGVVTWTPAEGVTTSGAVTLTVSDGNEDGAVDATEVFTITVTAVNDGPSITSTAVTTATEDSLYTYTATVTDPDDANNGTDLTWTLSGAPAGMVVSSTGVVTWTPGEGVTTSGAVTLTVSDGNEDGAVDATEVFTITVTPVNDAPTITSTAGTTATEDTLYTYTATVNDPDDANNGTDLTWTLSGAPAGMVVSSTGAVTWTPAGGVTTSGAVTLTVSDGNEDGAVDATEVFTITVTPVNQGPSITSTAGTSATEDSLYTYTATVTDPDDANNGTDLTWTLSGAPAGMVVSSTGVVTWTPTEGVTTSGPVTLTVSDGNEDGAVDATEVFTIAVTSVNDGPSITSTATVTATEDTLYTYTATVSDPDDANNGTDLTWTLSGAPAGMVVSSTGVVTWTPAGGVTSSGSVTLTVSDGNEDGALDATQVFTITVTPLNDAVTGSVTIDNINPAEGDLLTASNDLADADGLGSIAYQWQRDGADIAAATGSTYTTLQADVGASITVVASYTDGLGFDESVASAPTADVTNVNDAPTGSVTIDSVAPAEGDLLTATNDLADEDGLGTITYQWQRDGAPLAGETSDQYALTQADVGSTISVIASYVDAFGTAESVSSTVIGPVLNRNDLPTGAPVITGISEVGETLTALTSTIADLDGLGDFNYDWQRASDDGLSWETVGSGDSYALVEADSGAELRVMVSYTDGQATLESLFSYTMILPAPVEPVLPELPIDEPTLIEEPTGGTIPPDTGGGGGSAPIEEGGPVPGEETSPNGEREDKRIAGSTRGLLPEQAIPQAIVDMIEAGPEAGESYIEEANREPAITAEPQPWAITKTELARVVMPSASQAELRHVEAVLNNPTMWQGIEAMKREMDKPESPQEALVVEMVSTTGVGLMAGLVAYGLRGGALMASLMSTMPLWQTYDPLPILAAKKKKSKPDSKAENSNTEKEKSSEIEILFE